MLKSETATEESTSSSSGTAGRAYTDEEFARAVAAVEARRLEQQNAAEQIAADRLTLAEIGSGVSHEEVVAEIENTRQAARFSERQRRSRRRRRRLALSSSALLATVGLGILWNRAQIVNPTEAPSTVVQMDAPRASSTSIGPGQAARWSLDKNSLVIVGGDGAEVVKTFGEVPEGDTARVTADTLYGQMNTADALLKDASNPALSWTVVKHGGSAYVRVWLQHPLSDAALRVGNVLATNVRPLGKILVSDSSFPNAYDESASDVPTQVTVPLRDLSAADPTLNVDSRCTAVRLAGPLHVDRFLHEASAGAGVSPGR